MTFQTLCLEKPISAALTPVWVLVYCRWLNVYDVLARLCIPKRYRFDEETGDDDHTERGKICVRQELVRFSVAR
jgi:hypothetical protein